MEGAQHPAFDIPSFWCFEFGITYEGQMRKLIDKFYMQFSFFGSLLHQLYVFLYLNNVSCNLVSCNLSDVIRLL